MRLAYVCADPGVPVFGTKGASVHVQEILRAWRARGAEVRLYATRLGEQMPADLADVPVVHVPVPPAPLGTAPGRADRVAARERAQADAARRIAERVVADGADAVHERYSLFSTALAVITGALGVPGVLEVNAPLVDEQRTHRDLVDEDAARAALAAQVAAAERTACVSEPVARWVQRTVAAAGGEAGRVLVAPNGVNVERILPSRDSAARGPDPGPPVVVFVGTLKPWHGVEHLLRARASAATDWHLRVVGDGPQRAFLEELAASLGVEAEFTGAVAPAEVPGLLAGCAVAVAPYPATADAEDQYFSPLKIYEYAAAALPVVASRVGQVPAAVQDGVTGLLVAPSDPAALARAIDALVADPGRRRAMGRAGRRDAVARRSWTAVLDDILADTGLAGADPRGTPRSGSTAPRPSAAGAPR
ncbi:glycosyltransferase family 4 protein [Kocuria turfanensis]|uniref:D-inositol 3-phosphate glycosyltransferase n=1 Tax=Kocuria turfanensis TaxID=388357 RepID=A0A512IB75_9MICC|nr:glycosyltransferase family 4 protein [Kocuria turfanensis]GEO94948.1 glycosyl transferase [Kocuria turfanensis]